MTYLISLVPPGLHPVFLTISPVSISFIRSFVNDWLDQSLVGQERALFALLFVDLVVRADLTLMQVAIRLTKILTIFNSGGI